MATVTIIGAGNMARGIATRLVEGKADLQVLAPKAEEATALADELRTDGSSVTGAAVNEPMTGDVVVVAVPYDAALEIAASRGRDLAGKVVIDITNPVDRDSFDRLVTCDSSAAEEIAGRLNGSRVVKAFNTTFAGALVAGEVAGHPLDVLIAGDDGDAKAQAANLVEAGGLRAVDVGPLRRARQLEHLGFLHMAVQESLGSEYGSAVKFVTPS